MTKRRGKPTAYSATESGYIAFCGCFGLVVAVQLLGMICWVITKVLEWFGQ